MDAAKGSPRGATINSDETRVVVVAYSSTKIYWPGAARLLCIIQCAVAYIYIYDGEPSARHLNTNINIKSCIKPLLLVYYMATE